MYVEFIGQPGAGKSTVGGILQREYSYYPSPDDDCIERWFRARISSKWQPLNTAAWAIPSRLNALLFEDRVRCQAQQEFLSKHPEFLWLLTTIEGRDQEHTASKIRSLISQGADFQLKSVTVPDRRRLCIPQAFCHYAHPGHFPIEAYLDIVPIGDVVVFLDVPVEVALERQHQRGQVIGELEGAKKAGFSDAQEYQEQARERNELVANLLSERTTVVQVDATPPAEQVAETVFEKLDEM